MSQFSYIERFVSRHGFSRAAKVLQSCHSEPSATALARRELALSEAKGHARNLLLVRRFTYEPIFLHRRFVSGHGFSRAVRDAKIRCRAGTAQLPSAGHRVGSCAP